MKYRDNDHFSVIRGIGKNGSATLTDPSWGNRRFTKHQFLDIWETRADENLKGKVLLILPDGIDAAAIDRSFFGLIAPNPVLLEKLLVRY